MNRKTVLINLFTILLFVSTLSGAYETQILKNKNIFTSFVVKKAAATTDSYKSDKTKKYDSVDGSTSVSQLRAKRSHSVINNRTKLFC